MRAGGGAPQRHEGRASRFAMATYLTSLRPVPLAEPRVLDTAGQLSRFTHEGPKSRSAPFACSLLQALARAR